MEDGCWKMDEGGFKGYLLEEVQRGDRALGKKSNHDAQRINVNRNKVNSRQVLTAKHKNIC